MRWHKRALNTVMSQQLPSTIDQIEEEGGGEDCAAEHTNLTQIMEIDAAPDTDDLPDLIVPHRQMGGGADQSNGGDNDTHEFNDDLMQQDEGHAHADEDSSEDLDSDEDCEGPLPDARQILAGAAGTEGSDHAESTTPQNSNSPASSLTPTPLWRTQTQQSTCEFSYVIENYSSKRESGCKKAEYSPITTDSYGNKWRLIVYVNGNGRASNHHLSLFLQVADADDLPFGWKKAVSYVLTLEHPSGTGGSNSMGYSKRNPDKTFKLCPKAIDWGWSQFITSDRIQQEGYISNDSLTVRATVTVKSSSVSIDESDAELYLKYAVEEGKCDAVKTCLEQGASVNCQFKDDLYTPLHTACSSSNTNSKKNKENDDDSSVSKKDKDDSSTSESPPTAAQHLEVLNLLLEEGADPNACNKWKETPLLIAANNGNLAAVDALLEHGADPSMCSEAGWSALTFAAHKGYDKIVDLLLENGAPVNCQVTEDLSTPLHKACAGSKEGHQSAVKQLIKGGADVHALNKWRETPLLTAANHGQAAAVEALLQDGADPCKCTDTGWSPLSIAAYKGHDDVVKLLLEEGAPTEEADPTLSALLQAATKGLPETVDLLLRHGADHTVTTKKGDTALSILVEQNLIDAAVEMVTDYNASIPRCSRDRKKVQRARLLINLQIKKQQREGRFKGSLDDDSDHDETDTESASAQHDPVEEEEKKTEIIPIKGKKSKVKADEARAKAAADELLRELEMEDQKAQQKDDAASKRAAKKKKKKERDRAQKVKEEQEQRERLEKEAKERERLRRERIEKERREREQQERIEREQRQAEMEAVAKRELELARIRKEKEAKEKKLRDQHEKERKAKEDQEKKAKEETAKREREQAANLNAKKASADKVSPEPESKATGKNRGWETSTASSTSTKPANQSIEEPISLPMEQAKVETVHDETSAATQEQPALPLSLEPEFPLVALLRDRKVDELLSKFHPNTQNPSSRTLLSVINYDVARTLIYRWIVRSSHAKTVFMDPLIPSWSDESQLAQFFQRQLISLSRRGSDMGNIEVLKEAGTIFARICFSIAKDVEQFTSDFKQSHPTKWNDVMAGLSISNVVVNGKPFIRIALSNHDVIDVPYSVTVSLKDRYVGSEEMLVSAIYAAVKRYDTLRKITAGTFMDSRIAPNAVSCLVNNAGLNFHSLSNSLSANTKCTFCTLFPDVDEVFGGIPAFGKDVGSGGEVLLSEKGGSCLIIPPAEGAIATMYMKKLLDLLENSSREESKVPLSITVILQSECLRDMSESPSLADLSSLDSRIGGRPDQANPFLLHVEEIPAGKHIYFGGGGEGKPRLSSTGSFIMLFQNEEGRSRFPIDGNIMQRFIGSFVVNPPTPAPQVKHQPVPAQTIRLVQAPIIAQPIPAPVAVPAVTVKPIENISRSNHSTLSSASALPPIERQESTASHSSTSTPTGLDTMSEAVSSSRFRGRFFDLEDDDDQGDETISGVLNNLDLFSGNGEDLGEVDVEAFSLMGFGNSVGHSENGPTKSRFLQ